MIATIYVMATRSFGHTSKVLGRITMHSIPPLNLNDTEISDSFHKANAFNDYFKSVFTIENLQSFPAKGPSPHPDIDDITIYLLFWNTQIT